MSQEMDRLKNAIRRGGSVRFRGRRIMTVKDLPSEEELASDVGKVALRARSRTEGKNTAAAAGSDSTTTPVKSKKKVTAPVEEEEEEE